LHTLTNLKPYGVTTFQAEDEIAAVCSAIGASYAGKLGLTSSSGPGIALKTEAIGLALVTELPLVIVNVQRGGPSTGLPTKTEQSDLFQAVWGRNADTPLPVVASATPGDCFETAIEAVRLADQIHDAGDLPQRRLPRQRGRAVGNSRCRRCRAVPGRIPE
jgi:2-oxoglutarate ferredoxin oxidoreductase subunit alpha